MIRSHRQFPRNQCLGILDRRKDFRFKEFHHRRVFQIPSLVREEKCSAHFIGSSHTFKRLKALEPEQLAEKDFQSRGVEEISSKDFFQCRSREKRSKERESEGTLGALTTPHFARLWPSFAWQATIILLRFEEFPVLITACKRTEILRMLAEFLYDPQFTPRSQQTEVLHARFIF